MIISVSEAKELVNIGDWSDKKIERKLKAIEQVIRSYTNNNFQKKLIHFGESAFFFFTSFQERW